MKKLLLGLMLLFSFSALSMENEELTGKLLSNKDFVSDVRNKIRNTFSDPQDVVMKFHYAGAYFKNKREFISVFYYDVKIKSDGWFGDVHFGVCPMKFSGNYEAGIVDSVRLIFDGCTD